MEIFKILNEGIYVPSLSLVLCWVLLWEDTGGGRRRRCSQELSEATALRQFAVWFGHKTLSLHCLPLSLTDHTLVKNIL